MKYIDPDEVKKNNRTLGGAMRSNREDWHNIGKVFFRMAEALESQEPDAIDVVSQMLRKLASAKTHHLQYLAEGRYRHLEDIRVTMEGWPSCYDFQIAGKGITSIHFLAALVQEPENLEEQSGVEGESA